MQEMCGQDDLVRKFFPATPYSVDAFETTLFHAEHPGGTVDPEALTIYFVNSWNNPQVIGGHYALITSPITESTDSGECKFRYSFCLCMVSMALILLIHMVASARMFYDDQLDGGKPKKLPESKWPRRLKIWRVAQSGDCLLGCCLQAHLLLFSSPRQRPHDCRLATLNPRDCAKARIRGQPGRPRTRA